MNDLAGERYSSLIPCDLPLQYKINGLGTREGRITNLSTLGVLFTPRQPVPLGAEVVLHFLLPVSNRRLQTAGTVNWVGEHSVGVMFANLSFQEKDEIWRFYARESARTRQARS